MLSESVARLLPSAPYNSFRNETSMQGFLKVEGLSKAFMPAKPVFANVSFSIDKGEFVCIIGHSGCGKTTVLNVLAGLDTATSGHVFMDNREIGGPGLERGVVFQSHALMPWLSVRRNIAFAVVSRWPDWSAAQVRAQVEKFVAMVGLSTAIDKKPSQLSGGMKQRVSIARALSVDPEVLLMDEPFAALDAQNRALMQKEMGRLLAEANAASRKTMVLVTHSIEEAILLSDRIIVLSRRPGRVKENMMVELPRPRNEDEPAFIALRHRLRDLINEEITVEAPADALPETKGTWWKTYLPGVW